MRVSLLIGSVLLLTVPARADLLTVTSYDMPNGYGQDSGGSYNYWDGNYTGSGNKTVDGAALSGGVGALTDGIVTSQPWNNVSNLSGTGPFVGWRFIDPTITFHLASVSSYQQVAVHVDNSFVGGVSAPESITVSDGVNSGTFAVATGTPSSPFWAYLNVSSLGLSGSTIYVTLTRGNEWVFSDEIQFSGVAVPEPSSLVIVGCSGVVGLGLVLRRARKGAA
jgi:hypothetical protein